jgi:hypothetical protein
LNLYGSNVYATEAGNINPNICVFHKYLF